MSSKTHSFELFASIVNFYISPRVSETGEILIPERQEGVKMFSLLDTTTLEEVISFPYKELAKVLQMLTRYYKKYDSLPSKIMYDDLKNTDPIFLNWLNTKASDDKRENIIRLDLFIFEPIQDHERLKEIILDLSVKIKVQTIIRAATKALSISGQSALDSLVSSGVDYKEKTESVLVESVASGRFLYSGKKDAKDYQGLSGVRTPYDLIRLQPNGLFVLQGGPKDGKTRLIIAICRYLARRGYDVGYLDLENGDKELEARFLLADLTEYFKYDIGVNYLYSGTFIHKDRIPNIFKEWTEENKSSIKSGDSVYKIIEWTEIETDPDTGEEIELVFIKANLYRSLVTAPDLDPEEDVENLSKEWDFVTEIEDAPNTDPEERIYESMQSILDRVIPIIKKDFTGEVKIEYVPSAHIEVLHNTVKTLISNPKHNFFARAGWRVLIVDWMQLVQNKGELYQAIRANYATFKEWQAKYKTYVIIVDGVKDFNQLEKLYPNLKAAGTVGSTQTDYAVSSSVLFCASEEEKKSRTFRLVAKRTRYGKSGTSIQEFFRVNPEYATVEKITKEEHQNLNQNLWNESEETNSKASKDNDLFGGIKLKP